MLLQVEFLPGTFMSKRKHTHRITCSKIKLDFATFEHKARKHTNGIERSETDKLDFADEKRDGDFVKTIEE